MTLHDPHVSLFFRRVHSSQPELQTASWLQAVGEGRQTVFAGEAQVLEENGTWCSHTHTHTLRAVSFTTDHKILEVTASALAVDAMSISYTRLVQITMTRILFTCSNVNLTAGIDTQQPWLAIRGTRIDRWQYVTRPQNRESEFSYPLDSSQ